MVALSSERRWLSRRRRWKNLRLCPTVSTQSARLIACGSERPPACSSALDNCLADARLPETPRRPAECGAAAGYLYIAATAVDPSLNHYFTRHLRRANCRAAIAFAGAVY